MNCSDVLTRVAEQFSLEYQNVVQVINLSKTIGNDTSLVFKYGKGQGLYNLIRKQVQDQNILTRVYGYGSTKTYYQIIIGAQTDWYLKQLKGRDI